MEIIFLLVGLLFGFLGIYIIWDHIHFLGTAHTVTGTVVALEKRSTPSRGSKKPGGPMYYPVINYVADGSAREFTSKYGMGLPQYDLGTTVPVAYSRKRDEARIKQKMPFIGGGILASVGVVLCVLFFNIFQFTAWSWAVAAVVTLGILISARNKLHSHDISTLDELQEAFRNTDMKTSRGTEPEEIELISDKEKLHRNIYRASKPVRWIGPIFTAVGIAAVVLGVYLGKQRAEFLESAHRSQGEVVSLNSKSSDDGYVYYPVVRYAPSGSSNTISFEHETGSNPPSYSVGERVEVLYHPEDPSHAIIDSGFMNWFGPGIIMILGVLFSAAGIYTISHWRKIRHSEKTYSGIHRST